MPLRLQQRRICVYLCESVSYVKNASQSDVGDEFFDQVAKLGDLVVLVVAADVEGLAFDGVQGGFQAGQDGLSGVVHVDEGPPLVAAEACTEHFALGT